MLISERMVRFHAMTTTPARVSQRTELKERNTDTCFSLTATYCPLPGVEGLTKAKGVSRDRQRPISADRHPVEARLRERRHDRSQHLRSEVSFPMEVVARGLPVSPTERGPGI